MCVCVCVCACVCCRIQRSPTLRQAFQYGQRACLAGGWDVVDADEFTLSERAWARLAGGLTHTHTHIHTHKGERARKLVPTT